jgi:hypothetical protein
MAMSPVGLRTTNYCAGECQQQFHSRYIDKKMDGLDRSVSEGSQSRQAVKYGNESLETPNHEQLPARARSNLAVSQLSQSLS